MANLRALPRKKGTCNQSQRRNRLRVMGHFYYDNKIITFTGFGVLMKN
jgi:hypothetical protein